MHSPSDVAARALRSCALVLLGRGRAPSDVGLGVVVSGLAQFFSRQRALGRLLHSVPFDVVKGLRDNFDDRAATTWSGRLPTPQVN